MSRLWEVYADSVHDEFKVFYANWPPTRPIELGDFGVLDGDLFTRRGNIKKGTLKVSFTPRLGNDTSADYEVVAAESTELNFVAKGQANGVPVNASVEFKFSEADTVYMKAAQCSHDSIEDEVALGKQILRLLDNGQWNTDWVVVTQLVKAGATTIVVSSAKNATLRLDADANVPNINLADAKLSLMVGRQQNVGLRVVTEKNCVPLIGFSKVETSFWPPRRSKWESVSVMRDSHDMGALLPSLVGSSGTAPDGTSLPAPPLSDVHHFAPLLR